VKIAQYYSHLNGWEHIRVHKTAMWAQIEQVVGSVDASQCLTKVSKERRTHGTVFFSPIEMNKRFKTELSTHGWKERRTSRQRYRLS